VNFVLFVVKLFFLHGLHALHGEAYFSSSMRLINIKARRVRILIGIKLFFTMKDMKIMKGKAFVFSS